MTFAERLKLECFKRNETVTSVCEKLGFSHGAFTYWRTKKATPNAASIAKFCDYFQLSKEEFLSNVNGLPSGYPGEELATSEQNETIQEPILTEQEREIIEIYRAMPIRKQYEFLRAMFEISHDGGMV